MLAVTTGAAVHVRRQELTSEFGDGGFSYRLNLLFPLFLCCCCHREWCVCEPGEPCRGSFPGRRCLTPVGRNCVPQPVQFVWSRQGWVCLGGARVGWPRLLWLCVSSGWPWTLKMFLLQPPEPHLLRGSVTKWLLSAGRVFPVHLKLRFCCKSGVGPCAVCGARWSWINPLIPGKMCSGGGAWEDDGS